MWSVVRHLFLDVRFQSRARLCRYVVEKVELGQVFLRMLRIYPVALIPLLFHAFSFHQPRRYKMFRYAGQDGTEFHLDLQTGRPLTQSDYIRSCINTIVLLRMSTELLGTCRGFK
jgi:hypothetical protein